MQCRETRDHKVIRNLSPMIPEGRRFLPRQTAREEIPFRTKPSALYPATTRLFINKSSNIRNHRLPALTERSFPCPVSQAHDLIWISLRRAVCTGPRYRGISPGEPPSLSLSLSLTLSFSFSRAFFVLLREYSNPVR